MSRHPENRPIEVLLVEDNPGDVRLIQETLKENKVLNKIHVVEDGTEAIAFLRSRDHHQDKLPVDLILLDLNLPRMDGHEVLEEIKQDPDLKRIPVVILTVSKAEEDILKSYNLHANCFITKPVEFDKFIEVVKSIKNFWLTIVKLPPE